MLFLLDRMLQTPPLLPQVLEDAVPLAPQPVIIEQLQYYPVSQSKWRLRRVNVLPSFQFQTYLLEESARTQAFIPHLCGFLGMYWRKASRPTMLKRF